jgi:hypothetical protein
MSIHSGHPELYSPIQDHIGELIYDNSNILHLTPDSEIEKIKTQTEGWVSMSQQEELSKFE